MVASHQKSSLAVVINIIVTFFQLLKSPKKFLLQIVCVHYTTFFVNHINQVGIYIL